MAPAVDLVTLSGVVALGLVHGAEPGHGWPIAATYALDTSRKWFFGLVAGLVIGIGHLISSLAVVAVFFLAKTYFGIAQFPWLNEAAGILLVLLGIHEYRHGHSHGHGDGHGHDGSHTHDDGHAHDDHGHDDNHGHTHDGNHSHDHVTGIRDGGLQQLNHDDGHTYDDGHTRDDSHDDGHGHSHDHGNLEDAADRGLWGLASAAFVLGFAHEEEFEIIGICAGTDACLTLMVVYALAVIVSLVGLTLLLVAGYHRYQDRVERIAPHFSTISAVVLIGMGLLFIAGVL